MDTLDMHGGLAGAAEATMDYDHDPLRAQQNGGQRLAVVSNEEFLNVGLAATYDRYRVYLNFTDPLLMKGDSGNVGSDAYTAPSVNLGTSPDNLADTRIGFDARILGDAGGAFRLGLGSQLYIPGDTRADYDTDGRYRAMERLLIAGDQGIFTYAGQAGVHIRSLNESSTPGSPQGSEFLFGVAGGVKLPVGGEKRLVVGPEVYGATALRSFMEPATTDLEWLLSGRLEGTGESDRQARIKAGIGAGINPQFGAPEWRLVFAIEFFGWLK